MGPEPAVNAVFYNKIQAIDDPDERAAFVADRIAEYEADVDLLRLGAELVSTRSSSPSTSARTSSAGSGCRWARPAASPNATTA